MGAAVAAGGGAAIAISSCGSSGKSQRSTTVSTNQMKSDASVLDALLDLEHMAVAAYGVIAGKLRGAQAATARRFLIQESAHAAALERSIRGLGEAPQTARSPSQYAATFPTLRGPADALSFALDIETTAISAYGDAIGKLATLPLRGLVASILTTESEHAAVVLGDLHRPQVPQAFVTGPPPQPEST